MKSISKKIQGWDLYCFFIILVSFAHSSAWARPEYAVKYSINRCTACHISPVGGGVRNLNGKQFGTRQLGLSPFAKQEYFSADVRMLYLDPSKKTGRGGMGLMAALFSLTVPISPDNDHLMLSYTHDIGGWSTYDSGFFRWKNSEDTQRSILPQYIIVGRFHSPFGLLTDEHRTYYQIQTQNQWNTNFDMGAVLSANPTDNFHYDWAITNGEKTAGGVPAPERASLWGSGLNLRFMPLKFPILFGVSGANYERANSRRSPWAYAGYALLSFDRLTNYKFRGSVSVQYTRARYMNESIQNFVTDINYFNAITSSESASWYSQLIWDISDRFSLVYKFDQLLLDVAYPADYYLRHGFGVKHLIAPNGYVTLRYEKADATHPTEEHGTGVGASDGFWAMLQISI